MRRWIRLRDGSAAWAAAAAASAGWLALFPALWPPAPAPRPPPPAPVRPVVYLARTGGATAGGPDSRTVWSPVLFSLPSAAGFSRAPSHAGELKPPLDLPEAALPVLARESAPVTNRPTVLAAAAPPAPPRPAPRRAGDAEEALPPPPAVEKVSGTTGLPPDADLPVPLARRGARAWEAEAAVEFDASGLVRHVFVERSEAEPSVTAELARGLYRWRLPPGGGAGDLRVRFRHDPRAAPTAGGPRP